MNKHSFGDKILTAIYLRIRKYLTQYLTQLWRETMKTYPITYCTTSPSSYRNEDAIDIPESAALRKLIEKFAEYRNQIAEDKDKREFDDFLETVRKSTSDTKRPEEDVK